MKRICITGTESTGKTALGEELAAHFNVQLVPDISREYVAALNRPYTEEDVLEIAKQIIEAENKALLNPAPLLISDNDLINIKIWLRYYKWAVPAWLEEEIVTRRFNLYLLCYIDVPWQADEQRVNRHDRNELFMAFTTELAILDANYKTLKGSQLQRKIEAISHIEKIFM